MTQQDQAILVLYHCRGTAQFPLRTAIADHLFSFGRYSRYPVIYRNIAYGFEPIDDLPLKAVILHSISLSLRWDPDYFQEVIAPWRRLSEFDIPKIALPQDEFIHTDALVEFFNAIGVTDILTIADQDEARKIYAGINPNVTFHSVLTGYLDPKTLGRIKRLERGVHRDIDVGYRAWDAEAWLGEHGRLKTYIAQKALEIAPEYPDLKLDVSVNANDTFYGDDWYRFLLRCRATLGVEGGASVLDRDGQICARTRAYKAAHPEASFETIRDACFADAEHSLRLFAIGPRHLEACATRTCQILVEGDYQGIFKPWVHYIPVKRDLSDLGAAMASLKDQDLVKRLTDQAYKDIVGSERFGYEHFVRTIEQQCIDRAPRPVLASPRRFFRNILRIRQAMVQHWISWNYARFEAHYLFRYSAYFSHDANRDMRLRWRTIRKLARWVRRLGKMNADLPE